MKTPLIPMIALTALAGCATVPTQTALESMSVVELCELNHSPPIAGNTEAIADAALRELGRRKAFSEADLIGFVNFRARIGMPEAGIVCAWGTPSKVNRTITANGVRNQFVYENYLGRTTGSTYKFAYSENGVITAIQD